MLGIKRGSQTHGIWSADAPRVPLFFPFGTQIFKGMAKMRIAMKSGNHVNQYNSPHGISQTYPIMKMWIPITTAKVGISRGRRKTASTKDFPRKR